jgi:hypothetical protein
MMFVPQRNHTYGPPRPVTGIALLNNNTMSGAKVRLLTILIEVFRGFTQLTAKFWDSPVTKAVTYPSQLLPIHNLS